MLRAYRKTFMGTMSERSQEIADLRPAQRLPGVFVVGGLLRYGFFPQSLVRMVTPVLHSYVTSDRHLTAEERCSHCAVRCPTAMDPEYRNAPQGNGYKVVDK